MDDCREHSPDTLDGDRFLAILRSCDEDNKTEVCAVEPASILGHYYREDQGRYYHVCSASGIDNFISLL